MTEIKIENFDIESMAKDLFEALKARTIKAKQEKLDNGSEVNSISLELDNIVLFLDKDFADLTDYERYAMLSGTITIIQKTLDRLQQIGLAQKKRQLNNQYLFTSSSDEFFSDDSTIVDKRRIK